MGWVVGLEWLPWFRLRFVLAFSVLCLLLMLLSLALTLNFPHPVLGTGSHNNPNSPIHTGHLLVLKPYMRIRNISLPFICYLERFLTLDKDPVNLPTKYQLPDFYALLFGVELEFEGLLRIRRAVGFYGFDGQLLVLNVDR